MSILLQRYDFLIQTLYRITTIIINLSLSYKPRHTISSKLLHTRKTPAPKRKCVLKEEKQPILFKTDYHNYIYHAQQYTPPQTGIKNPPCNRMRDSTSKFYFEKFILLHVPAILP